MIEIGYISLGDAARMHEDGKQRVEQAVKAQTELEKKLAQMERKTLLTLNNTEQLHREQLEAERQLKVQSDLKNGACLSQCESYALAN